MIYNPETGQYEEIGTGSTVRSELAYTGMDMAGIESSTAFAMAGHLPGATALLGYAGLRGSNTIMRGGFSDKGISMGADAFLGSRSRRARMAADPNKAPTVKGFFKNYVPYRPGQFTRYANLGIVADYSMQAYTPFRGAQMFERFILPRSERIRNMFTPDPSSVADGKSLFGPGFYSAVSAGVRIDRLEKTAQGAGRAARRAQKKLDKVDKNLHAIAAMNRTSPIAVGPMHIPSPGTSAVGVRGNILASIMPGSYLQQSIGFVRGALGRTSAAYLGGQADIGAKKAVGIMQNAIDTINQRTPGAITATADDVLKQGALKGLGGIGNVMTAATGKGGLKFAGLMGARAVALGIPGLNLVAAASMAYDVGKMAGELVKGGINLVKDANISMQGSLAKPIFGMGYRDTEAAATSRSRGVMAIQNSRLNARSALGSEASMLAAHYG